MNENNLRCERLSLLIGTMVGQISELLNNVKSGDPSRDEIYERLLDIHMSAGLQVHELFYKGNKQ